MSDCEKIEPCHIGPVSSAEMLRIERAENGGCIVSVLSERPGCIPRIVGAYSSGFDMLKGLIAVYAPGMFTATERD